MLMTNPISSPFYLSASEIETLVAQEQLLRILRPDLQQHIQAMITKVQNPYVVQHEGHIYLRLDGLEANNRHTIYQLIQRLQVGEDVNLAALPDSLRGLLEPEPGKMSRFIGALLFGGSGGIALGVVGMAVGILITAVYELITRLPVEKLMGMDLSAVFFITFCALGWAGTTLFFWRRQRPFGKTPSPS